MREYARTAVEAEGAAHLERESRLSCRPRRHHGETEHAFLVRLAAEYGISVQTAAEIMGL